MVLRQAQSLVITPQLLQAIRLLQMPSAELERLVAAEVEQNPFLQVEDEGDVPAGPSGLTRKVANAPAGVAHWERQGPAGAGPSGRILDRSGRLGAVDEARDEDFGAAPATSFFETLEWAIANAFAALPRDRRIAMALLAAVDEAGYLTTSIESVSAEERVPPSVVEAVLLRCQHLGPSGTFARSLAECLALQLAATDRLDPAMRTMLAHLDLVALDERAALAEICGVDCEDIDDMLAEIRALDPKPGLNAGKEPALIPPPDVLVRGAPDGGFIVELNDAALPRLIVDRAYHAQVAADATKEAERKYLSECLQKATWLERSLDQRARTVLAVASEIVRRQAAFLAEGVSMLRPLNLKTVAEAIGLHESTVSRAAANKTMATPRGLFEFRYFFPVAIAATAGGDEHSSEAVRHRIRQLILRERPDRILSDDAIAAILSRDGVGIARRTVAKYRELMRIGSSVARRRAKFRRAAS